MALDSAPEAVLWYFFSLSTLGSSEALEFIICIKRFTSSLQRDGGSLDGGGGVGGGGCGGGGKDRQAKSLSVCKCAQVRSETVVLLNQILQYSCMDISEVNSKRSIPYYKRQGFIQPKLNFFMLC